MDIDAVGYIRPALHGETVIPLLTEGSSRLLARPGGPGIDLQRLHHAGSPVSHVYQTSVESLVELLVAGFNVSLLVVGESGSGKSYLIAGNNSNGSGLVRMVLDNLFTKINAGERSQYTENQSAGPEVSLQMYEVYNEMVKDLQQTPSLSQRYNSTEDTAKHGTVVKNGKSTVIRSASEADSLFRQAWSRRADQYMDYGPAKNYSSLLIYLDVIMHSKESPLPNKSRFSIILTPGAEKLSDDSRQVRVREGPSLSKTMVAVSQLVATLANQPYPDRVINYHDSVLTSFLKNEVGGNCKTRVIFCMKPQNEPKVFEPIHQLVYNLTRVKNFPILNDPFAQQLLTQYRAVILNLKQQIGWGTGLSDSNNLHSIHDELKRLQTENITLRDQNERLHERLNHLQNRFGTLASTKTDLSSQLLLTEEEKLKISKTMVEMQIENNKLAEEAESTKFELTNKILRLESDLAQLEVDRDKHSQGELLANDQLESLERDRSELADEYITLKANHTTLKEAHQNEVTKNEELSVELLNLVNAKAALMKRLDKVEASSARYTDPNAELDRVRAIVSRMSTRQTGDIQASEEERQRAERNLFGSQAQLQEDIKTLKKQNEDHVRKLEDRIAFMRKEMHDTRNLARERQRKVSQMNARLITLGGELEHLKNQNNKLQHKFKDINDEFRVRLDKYIQDIAKYIEGRGDVVRAPGVQEMREYVDGMLSDMRRAHRVREEQLAQAAHSYRQRLKQVTSQHEQLIVAYREVRLECKKQGVKEVDLGPDEYEMRLTDPEFMTNRQKEIDQLREQLDHALQQVEALKFGLKTDNKHEKVDKRPLVDRERSFSELRKQMREWTQSTQQDLEQERARLLTLNTVLEEEKNKLQTYIDTHLKRYKEEIRNLRGMLGVRDTSGLDSPDLRGHHHYSQSR